MSFVIVGTGRNEEGKPVLFAVNGEFDSKEDALALAGDYTNPTPRGCLLSDNKWFYQVLEVKNQGDRD